MISAFGIDHDVVISKLSGYDYKDKKGDTVLATRVGFTESNTPGKELSDTANFKAKKAGRVKILRPHTYLKANRVKAANEARESTLASGRATGAPATPGKYTDQVWEHKNTRTGQKSHTVGMVGDTPYKGKYHTWGPDLNSRKPGYEVAKSAFGIDKAIKINPAKIANKVAPQKVLARRKYRAGVITNERARYAQDVQAYRARMS